MARQSKGLIWGLFLLRFGLGGFLALCSIDKIVSPQSFLALISPYYFVSVPPWVIMILGGVQLVLSLFFILGMYKTWTYGAAFLVQALALVTVVEKLLRPFGKDQVFLMLVPLLFAFGALFVMRSFDTKWTLTKKPGLFS